MNDAVLRFENVSKRFVFAPDRPSSLLESVIAFTRRGGRREKDELWAVRDVDFGVARGDNVGIIGRNGSGKSTLLKLATRIMRPTHGQVTTSGRISALLELGAGFHPDLTGRENIFLNGSVLGLSRVQVRERFDSIVAFSELADFIDMPVKHYSSGMYMRLGFSVAVHVDPDLLLVDEILAVGDQAFQEKCLNRIHDMRQSGVTIVMISHHLDTLRNMCSRLVWLDKGRMRDQGPTEEVAGRYVAFMNAGAGPATTAPVDFNRWGSRDVEITGVTLRDGRGDPRAEFRTGEVMQVEIAYRAARPVIAPEFGLIFHRADGLHLAGPNNRLGGADIDMVDGAGTVTYCVDRLPFLPGNYQISAAIHDSRRPHAYDYHDRAYAFQVLPGGTRELHGILALPAYWRHNP